MADEELSALFDDPNAATLQGHDLAAYFTETCPRTILGVASTSARTKFRDYLHARSVSCVKGSGQPILNRLFSLYPPPAPSTLNRRNLEDTSSTAFCFPESQPMHNNIQKKQAIRDMVKTPQTKLDQYAGPHEPPLLSSVREIFFSD